MVAARMPSTIGAGRLKRAASRKASSWVLSPISEIATTPIETRKASICGACGERGGEPFKPEPCIRSQMRSQPLELSRLSQHELTVSPASPTSPLMSAPALLDDRAKRAEPKAPPSAPKALFSYRKYWAHRFGTAPFLPMSRAEMDELGWDSCDVILVTGDAYVDHPSFGMALVGRLLEAQGFRVGILAQPDWQSAEPFKALGRPNLFFGVTAGNMDSMVNRYTADRRVRSDDA